MNNIYDRDLVGYGKTTPDPKWPDNARIAVSFVLNYEEGGENNILHGDAGSEAFLSEVVGEELPGHPVGAVSGPTFARETALDHPTAATVAFPFS